MVMADWKHLKQLPEFIGKLEEVDYSATVKNWNIHAKALPR